MQRPDVLASHPATLPASLQPISRLRRHWDFLAVVLLVLASLPVPWLSPGTLYLSPPEINLIDDSWHLDTSFKASRGLWFGRDVVFTYGPLFQWLASTPVRLRNVSMGAIHATCMLLPLWCMFLAGYLTGVLLLPEQPAWKRFVLVILLCVFWMPWESRTPFAVFSFAAFLRGWYALSQQTIRPVMLGGGAALLCVIAFLYSADAGAYALMALLLTLLAVAWEKRRDQRLLRACASALVAFATASLVLVIAVNTFAAKPFDFSFWRNSLAILVGYRWIEPASMTKIGKLHLLAATLVGGLVFLMRGVTARDHHLGITARSGFLLSAFAFAFLAMQSGLVRSYLLHIVGAVYVMVFLAGVVLFSSSSRVGAALAVLFAVGCSFFLGESPLLLATIRQNYVHLGDRLMVCPSGFREFDQVCYPGEFTSILQTTSTYLQQRSGPNDFIVIFPYQTIFGIASRRNVAGGVMQTYLVSGPYLSQVDIAGLEQAAAPVGLYLPEGELSVPVDGVPNFTRSPEAWLWTFRHYRVEEEPAPGIFGLQRDDSRAARITSDSRPLNATLQNYPVRKRSSVLDLGDIAWPTDDADFVRLRIKVHYSLWWKLRKPARLVLQIEHADGRYDRKPFIVEPNVSSEIWFYPWDDAELAPYFDAEEAHWRTRPRSAVTRLRVLVMPFDWVSVQPDSIEVQSADAVKFSMARSVNMNQ
jgi:hypothetical protein